MFALNSVFQPKGDQPQAIERIVKVFQTQEKHHILLGVTGSGKTFTMANVIQQLGIPTLVIAPNKTLAAQLYTELKSFFPKNHVGYFISYYDYYQPEAYIPSSDTYIAKDSMINEDIDKMRHESTRFLFEEKYTIIVSSVSCIYGLGSPKAYAKMVILLSLGDDLKRDDLLRQLVDIQYTRNDWELKRGSFRVKGSQVDILPSHEKDKGIRIFFSQDKISDMQLIDIISGRSIKDIKEISLYPNSHYVSEKQNKKDIMFAIMEDLGKRLRELNGQGKLVEAQRLEQRTMMDLELYEEMGFCPGIENYSRYLTGQAPGAPPACLLDYFPEDFLTIIDESHITVPQIGAMYHGDQSRKQVLVEHGFRLPSALDNRPLQFDEFLGKTDKILYVSATPGGFELERAPAVTEQIIRPTGLIDPPILILPKEGQIEDLEKQIQKTVLKEQGRVLVTTLTKKMSMEITDFFAKKQIKVRYLHSEIDSLTRLDLLSDLRKGVFDVLVGINLLREGLDLPEVKLVAILDADKEGFLRSKTSLIQTVGRAARNRDSRVIFYGDKITLAMSHAIAETKRRRDIQMAYNETHGITPQTVVKPISPGLLELHGWKAPAAEPDEMERMTELKEKYGIKTLKQLESLLQKKKKEMSDKSKKLAFEEASRIRDEVKDLVKFYLLLE